MLSLAEKKIQRLYHSLHLLSPWQMSHSDLIERIVFKLDIDVYYFDEPSEANNLGGKYQIFLNEEQSEQKIWQDFGHELGHHYLHEGNQRFMPLMYRNYQETHAINFAFLFCVPTFMLNQIELPPVQYEAAGIVSEVFNVEGEFAYQRLSKWLTKLPKRKEVVGF